MINLVEITNTLLLEQDSKLMTLKQSITKRMPITIDYRGPSPEVESGVRYDIEPIIMGNHATSDNLVIWAYVFSGTSKKGLPAWKMFRVDRIRSLKFNPQANRFDVNKLPGYEKGKAPNAMKSLGNVITFSPYWFDDREKYKIGRPSQTQQEPEFDPELTQQEPQDTQQHPELTQQEPTPPEVSSDKPEVSSQNFDDLVFNNISPKIQDVDGQKILSNADFEFAVNDLYRKKEGEWKNYQRNIAGNDKPGEGTRKRFDNESRNEINDILRKNNVTINDNSMLAEVTKRFKSLIN